MGNRRRILFILPLVLSFGLTTWLVILHVREPVYRGKSLRVWLDEAEQDDGINFRADTAIRAMGTDAVPALLKMVGTKDAGVRKLLLKLPKWIPIHLRPREEIQQLGWRGFHILGPVAKSAVPALIRLLHDDDAQVRAYAAGCLAEIGPDSRDAVPDITKNLSDALARKARGRWDDWEKGYAALALGEIGPPAASAIPQLSLLTNDPTTAGPLAQAALIKIKGESFQPVIEALNDTSNQSNWWRNATIISFIGTNVEPAVPALVAALQQTNRFIQDQALKLLRQIHARPELSIPAVTPFLQSTNGSDRATSIKIIHAFGLAGKPWFPTAEIIHCLDDPELEVRKHATNALREIAPEALPRR